MTRAPELLAPSQHDGYQRIRTRGPYRSVEPIIVAFWPLYECVPYSEVNWTMRCRYYGA